MKLTNKRNDNDIFTLKGLADNGSTLNTITRKYAEELVQKHRGKFIIKPGQKFPVENGGGHDVIFSGDHITVFFNKPGTEEFFEDDVYITPYDEIAYSLIIGGHTLLKLVYRILLFDNANKKILFKHSKEIRSFDVDKDSNQWSMIDYLGGHTLEELHNKW